MNLLKKIAIVICILSLSGLALASTQEEYTEACNPKIAASSSDIVHASCNKNIASENMDESGGKLGFIFQ